jgi:hypothetical protein
MEQHGKNLAVAHRLASGRAAGQQLARLAENERILGEVCSLLTAAVTANRRITPAAEWLLDNFYLIEEQIRTAKRHLPKGYSRELPRLAQGPSAKLPRVYDLAFEAISHGDGRVDGASLARFVAAYQTVAPLKMGELWAIPIMLRLALIENLRRVGVRIATGAIERNRAAAWADQMMDVAERDPKSLILVIADMARSNPPMASSFVAELARRLQGQSAALALPLTWIEQRLSELGFSIEQLVQSETQEQAGAQVSISTRSAVFAFWGRWLARVRRRRWYRRAEVARVRAEALRQDGLRLAILPARGGRSRRAAVKRRGAQGDQRHEGTPALLAGAKVRQAARRTSGRQGGRVSNKRRRCAFSAWALCGFGRIPCSVPGARLITVTLTAILLAKGHRDGVADLVLAMLGVLVLLAASQLAVAIVNWLATLLVTPHALPRMDFSKGLPTQARTLVVVPTMLRGVESIEGQIEALEVRFLANRDDYLQFGLLTDFLDAPAEGNR